MKLAEALILRADLQKKIQSLRERLGQNSLVQEGDQPHEYPDKLFKELDAVLTRFEVLVAAINDTNLTSKLSDGRSLTRAIARRDALVQHLSILKNTIDSCKKDAYRRTSSEIKWVVLVNVTQLQSQSDDLSKELRELNSAIQQANWAIDIDVQ